MLLELGTYTSGVTKGVTVRGFLVGYVVTNHSRAGQPTQPKHGHSDVRSPHRGVRRD